MAGAVFDKVSFWLLFLKFGHESVAVHHTNERTLTTISGLGYILEVPGSIPGHSGLRFFILHDSL
jgi:hypothetical protein